MVRDNSQRLQEILDKLIFHNPDILSVQVVSDDGLNVASGIPHENDDEIAVIASDIIDIAQDFCRRLEQGQLQRVVLEGDYRTTIVMNAGTRTVLAVLVPADVKLGLITLSMRRAAQRVAEIFD